MRESSRLGGQCTVVSVYSSYSLYLAVAELRRGMAERLSGVERMVVWPSGGHRDDDDAGGAWRIPTSA